MLKIIALPLYRAFMRIKLRHIAVPHISLHKLVAQLLLGIVFIAGASQTLAASTPAGVAPMSTTNAGNHYLTTTGYIDGRSGLTEISLLETKYTTVTHPVTDTSRISRGFIAGHAAVDYDGEFGDGIYAMLPGTVVLVSSSGPLGNHIAIQHENGVKTVYAHLQHMHVQPGQHVGRGAMLGTMGSTGRSTGSHLHIETYVNGVAVDPMLYLADAIL